MYRSPSRVSPGVREYGLNSEQSPAYMAASAIPATPSTLPRHKGQCPPLSPWSLLPSPLSPAAALSQWAALRPPEDRCAAAAPHPVRLPGPDGRRYASDRPGTQTGVAARRCRPLQTLAAAGQICPPERHSAGPAPDEPRAAEPERAERHGHMVPVDHPRARRKRASVFAAAVANWTARRSRSGGAIGAIDTPAGALTTPREEAPV